MTEIQPIARAVFALEVGESMSKQVRVARALKVLHGPGVTFHNVGDYQVFFTPGDHCGCLDCNQHMRQIIKGVHE
jgi:hypothetical protein